MNPRFQAAIKKSNKECPPIWFMRQAGRYHSHYQNLKQKYSFMELCKQPDLAAEVALGPIMDFDFDVSILFSDLLFPLEALGMGLEYNPGPQLGWNIRSAQDLKKLKPWQEALPHLEFQKIAMQMTRERLPKNKSLIGFVGGPWTLFSYAVQGAHDGHLIESKKMILTCLEPFNKILVPLLKANIQLQLDGGAELVMIFDTSAGELSPSLYKNYVESFLCELAHTFPGKLGYYSKGTHWNHLDGRLKEAPWAGLGVDHRWNLPEFLKKESPGFVQGNFDQALLHCGKEDFLNHLQTYIESLKALDPQLRASWVCGLGHGVLPQTPETNVRLFVETIRKVFT